MSQPSWQQTGTAIADAIVTAAEAWHRRSHGQVETWMAPDDSYERNYDPWLNLIVDVALGDVRAQVRVLLSQLWLAQDGVNDLEVEAYTPPIDYLQAVMQSGAVLWADAVTTSCRVTLIRQMLWTRDRRLYYQVAYVGPDQAHIWEPCPGTILSTDDTRVMRPVPAATANPETCFDLGWLPVLWPRGFILEREADACAARRRTDEDIQQRVMCT
jgi:hypothetical protein